MKNKNLIFLELLEAFFSNYLPDAVGASNHTIVSYKYAFRLLLEYMNLKENITSDEITKDMLDYNRIYGFLEWIENERGCSPSTKNQRLSALLSFSEYAQNRNFEAATVFRSSLLKIPQKKAHHAVRAVFTVDEISKLLKLPDERTGTGLRDKVILSFMYASGARAQEVCDLKIKNINFSDLRTTVVITGKGGKTRRISIPSECSKMIYKYIRHRNIADSPERHVFSSQTHEHMTISCLEAIFKKYVRKAKNLYPDCFLEKSYPPHSMRHSTASHMLEAGVPLMVIKNFLGHVSLQSTQIYAELSQGTVDKHLKEWNDKWFHNSDVPDKKAGAIPDFLNTK